MAVKYDPRIVNFVLVDFKGGAAFEPFKKLPHCVDIATNLMGNAVERIFIAIKAEMDRRAKLLADGRVGDLVEYRKRVIPKLRPGDPLPNTFPHLFIIVDEFAEMIAQNPEYKAQFESITRLGRAFGVTLILATQRPAGVVSDQMRVEHEVPHLPARRNAGRLVKNCSNARTRPGCPPSAAAATSRSATIC